jgi:DNA-binding CsgD family transcriptional regulator
MVFKAKQWDYLKRAWHLTPRELEVAKLVCLDFDNARISKKLHISFVETINKAKI